MFTRTLADKLEDFGYDDNLKEEETKLTTDNGGEEESRVSLEVTTEEDDTVVKATITHPDGTWTGTFHTNETQDENLAETIATEFQYWCEI